MMKCSVVIRAYNEGRHLPRLLEGITRQTMKEVEIVLVDSGSTDDTVKIAESFGAKIVHIQPKDFTFGRSLNLGVQAASHEIVVIASAHVYPVFQDWLERLLEPFSDSLVALTYGKQRGMRTTKFSEHQIFARWFPDVSDLNQKHPFCNNANAAIRKRVWLSHPYDENLTGLEDLDWAKWALSQGHQIAYSAEAEIIHIHDEKPKGVLNRYRREAMAFKKIYPEAHFNLYDFVRMFVDNVFSDLFHALKERTFWRSAASVFWFRWMQFWGTYQGYRLSAEWNWQLRQTFYYPRGIDAIPLQPRKAEPIRYDQEEE